MTKWKTDMILEQSRKDVAKATEGWTEGQLREKLAAVIAATTPITTTLEGIVNNPDYGRHGGMCVTSGLFLDQSLADETGDVEEPYGFVLENREWKLTPFKWSEPLPEGIEKIEASFANAESLHPDTEILSVWQYATACSIFVGSFDGTDVAALVKACRLNAMEEGK